MRRNFLFTAMLLLLISFTTLEVFAQNRVNFEVRDRYVVDDIYYADLWAVIPEGRTWNVGGFNIYLVFNDEALEVSDDISFVDVLNPDPAMAADPTYMMFQQTNVPGAPWFIQVMVTKFMGTAIAKTADFRIATMRFRILDGELFDNFTIAEEVPGMESTVVYDGVPPSDTELTYNCGTNLCYGWIASEPRIINQEDDPTITTSDILGSPFCAGEAVAINFVADGDFEAGNQFQAQLSDENGSFLDPIQIGTVDGTTSGLINGFLPFDLVSGTEYRIRVVSTDPVIIGEDNGDDLIIIELPEEFVLSDDAIICDGEEATINLSGSQQGYTYTLYLYDMDLAEEFIIYETIGTGDPLSWDVDEAGIYYVIATAPNSNCETVMFGEADIEVVDNPLVFDVVGGGIICDGDASTITLDGSEVGVMYQLLLDGFSYGFEVAGDGSEINWVVDEEGEYEVVAYYDGGTCLTEMNGFALVIIDVSPEVFEVDGGGEFCEGETAEIELESSEVGVEYTLYIDGDEAVAYDPIIGDGYALVWEVTESGDYSVLATQPNSGCFAWMNGLVEVEFFPTLNVYDVTGGGAYCENEDPLFEITLSGSDLGAEYFLIWNQSPLGLPLNGTGDELSWLVDEPGIYFVAAVNEGCVEYMDGTAEVIELPTPEVFDFVGGGDICEGEMLELVLEGSEDGINYVLFIDGDADLDYDVVEGTDDELIWEVTKAGTYTVFAYDPITLCFIAMNGEVEVNVYEFPAEYEFTGDAVFCEGENIALELTLSGSEDWATYQLYHNQDAVGLPIQGTGAPLDFWVTEEGIYWVVAWNTEHPLCESFMDGLPMIEVESLPIVEIDGEDEVFSETTETYTTDPYNGTILWEAIGGTIVGADNEESVQVLWGDAGMGEVLLTKTSLNGCFASNTFDVEIFEQDNPVPSVQARNFIFANVQTEQMIVRWTRGNGDRVLVVAKEGATTPGNPALGTEYDADAVFGDGDEIIADAYAIYDGTGRIMTLTGLEPGTDYTFKAFEYYDGGWYNVNNASLNPRTRTTMLAAPVLEDAENITPESFDISWSSSGNVDFYEVDVATDLLFQDLVWGWQTADVGPVEELTVDMLDGETQYFYRVRGVKNNARSAWSVPGTATTLVAEPDVPPSFVEFDNVTTNSMTVTWIPGNGANSIVLLSEDVIGDEPVDGEAYEVDDMIGGATVAYIGAGDIVELINLDAGTMYYVAVFTFNGADNATNYLDIPALGNRSTMAAEPTVAPSDVQFDDITTNSMFVGWTPGNGDYSIVLVSDDVIADLPEDGEEYEVDDVIGDSYVAYIGDGDEVELTGLDPETMYYVAVFTFNGEGMITNYNPTPALGNRSTMAAEPTVAPSDVVFSDVTHNSMTVGWTPGNGANSIVLVSEDVIGDEPVDGEAYDVDDVIGGSTVAYIGAGDEFNLVGLTPNTTYYVAVFTFNGAGTLTNYNPTAAYGDETTTEVFATKLAIITQPEWLYSGQTFSITVQSQDENGDEMAPGQDVTIVLSTDGPGNLTGTLQIILAANQSELVFNNLQYTNPDGQPDFVITASTLNDVLDEVDSDDIIVRAVAPTTQDRVLLFSNVTQTSMTINWYSGNGNNRILLGRANTAITDLPVNGVGYDASSVFGDEMLGTSAVLYNGPNTTVSVTGLTAGVTYHFRALGYNGEDVTASYNTITASFNPRPRATLSRDMMPGDIPDEYSIEDISSTAFRLSNISPNPAETHINFSFVLAESMPITMAIYDADGREVINLYDSQVLSKGRVDQNVNLGDLSSGVYLLMISSGEHYAVQSFVIVK